IRQPQMMMSHGRRDETDCADADCDMKDRFQIRYAKLTRKKCAGKSIGRMQRSIQLNGSGGNEPNGSICPGCGGNGRMTCRRGKGGGSGGRITVDPPGMATLGTCEG